MLALNRPLSFTLPPELEAREPPEARGLARDMVRLLVTFREGGRAIHARFRELPQFLRAGDLVVLNDSATLPAALTTRRADGAELPLHLSTLLVDRLWSVEPRGRMATAGDTLLLPGDGSAQLLAPFGDSTRLWVAQLSLPTDVPAYLARWGRPITYSYIKDTWPIAMYQNVYAAEPGSAEMPSAGRPFTSELLSRLAAQGVQIAFITLHTGVSSLEKEEAPYPERFTVPPETADAVNAASERGGRVIAVGTTVVRALESAADDQGRVVANRDWTDLVITSRRGVRVVDGLLTGFHEPAATHLAMLEAIAGRELVERAYVIALANGYLWHEFGDVHLIL